MAGDASVGPHFVSGFATADCKIALGGEVAWSKDSEVQSTQNAAKQPSIRLL